MNATASTPTALALGVDLLPLEPTALAAVHNTRFKILGIDERFGIITTFNFDFRGGEDGWRQLPNIRNHETVVHNAGA